MIYTPTLWCYRHFICLYRHLHQKVWYFILFCVVVEYLFISTWKSPFSVSCRADLVMNLLSFCLSEKDNLPLKKCIYLTVPGLSRNMQGLLLAAWELLVTAHGIQFLDQGSNLGPLHQERRVLATGPPGKSLMFHLWRQFCQMPFSWLTAFYLALASLQRFHWGSTDSLTRAPVWNAAFLLLLLRFSLSDF